MLGYVGMDDSGLSGIEREYEDQLHGRPGQMLISVDARKQWFGSVEKQPEPGENVVLTSMRKFSTSPSANSKRRCSKRTRFPARS